MKKGFALIMALIFIVLVATLGFLGLSFATKSAKQTGDIALKEQAEVLAYNAVDYATMAMQMHNYNINCLKNITIFYPNQANPQFIITTKLFYVNSDLANCNGHILSNATSIPISDIVYNAAVVDVEVRSTEANPPIRYFYRTTVIP